MSEYVRKQNLNLGSNPGHRDQLWHNSSVHMYTVKHFGFITYLLIHVLSALTIY